MKLGTNLFVLGLLTSAGVFGIMGCATGEATDDEPDTQEGNVTPAQVNDTFEQVQVCQKLFSDRAAFRDPDLQEGVLRWKCGDVPQVTVSNCEDDLDAIASLENSTSTNVEIDRNNALQACGDGFGQEYCEYNAISKGNVVNSVKSGRALKDSDVVECVFTSVHSDVKGSQTPSFHRQLGATLKTQLSTPERDLEGRVAGMKQSVNSRGAADTLIKDCSKLGASTNEALHKNAERQVACFRAWDKASAADKPKIAAKCAKTDLSNDAKWAATGLADAELNDADRDLAACTMVLKAEHGGVSWRNSDPTICARAYRATHECGVDFKGIGQVAPDFQGFSMQGWGNRDVLPQGCKTAQVDGKDYRQLVICTPKKEDVKTYRTQRKPLQQLCRDKFGDNVAMQAPMGALANLSKAKTETEFCSSFVAGAKKAQGQ